MTYSENELQQIEKYASIYLKISKFQTLPTALPTFPKPTAAAKPLQRSNSTPKK